jgi:selenocysteine lyase/cysteine desulfurase
MDGSIFDLEKIGKKCHSFGAKLLVDGTQSVGAKPMDVKLQQVDALICATYKWLFGPYSSAIGYISSDFHQNEALEESWMNRRNAVNFAKLADYESDYFPGAAKFNVGETNDFIKIPMLNAAFRQILDWKVSEIQNYCQELLLPLKNFMAENGSQLENDKFQAQHLIGFQLNKKLNAQALMENLKKNQIILSVRGNSLRVSPNVYNTTEDIQRLIEALITSNS